MSSWIFLILKSLAGFKKMKEEKLKRTSSLEKYDPEINNRLFIP